MSEVLDTFDANVTFVEICGGVTVFQSEHVQFCIQIRLPHSMSSLNGIL